MFKKDDLIKFEINPKKTRSRWVNNRDFGPTGEYAEGIVTQVTDYFFEVDALFPDKKVRTLN